MLTPEQEEALTGIFREVLKLPDLVLRDDLTAKEVPGWDSFNNINLIIHTEDQYGIRFKAEEVVNLRNVGEMKCIISKKISEK
jgi:acyl carrier protein